MRNLLLAVIYSSTTYVYRESFSARTFFLSLFILLLSASAYATVPLLTAHPEITTSDDQSTVIVNDAPDQPIISFGKSVVVQKRAKGVLAVGGDITIDGRIEGDVSTIGGNVIQKENAYIGGDVIVVGGSYKPESETPLREPGKQTVILGVFEEELRSFGQDPTAAFSPNFSVAFVAQRLVIALFWFIITLVFTTIAPGAVGRSVARINLSWLKVFGLGSAAFLGVAICIACGTLFLPDYLAATLALMGILIMFLGFVFGRVVLQVSLGKLIQKNFLAGSNQSETLAILIGVLGWTLLLSLPYIWVLAMFAIFAAGVGLVLTGKTPQKWQNS